MTDHPGADTPARGPAVTRTALPDDFAAAARAYETIPPSDIVGLTIEMPSDFGRASHVREPCAVVARSASRARSERLRLHATSVSLKLDPIQ